MFDNMSLNHHDLAWTGLNQTDIRGVLKSGINPLTGRLPVETKNIGMRELYIMSKCPEYVHFACKTLLNLEITPMQACILYMLWTHPFPMLIGSRGLSKAVRLHEMIRVKDGWTEIQNLKIGDKVYGRDGNLCSILDKTEILRDIDFYRVELEDGRSIEVCGDHQWKARINSGIRGRWKVVKTKDLIPYNSSDPFWEIPLAESLNDETNDYIVQDYVANEDGNGDSVKISNISYIGKGDGMCIQVDSPDNTYITKDYIVTHNSFSLAVYAMLRGALMQGTKIVLVGGSFRQSKIIHAYVEAIFKEAPIFQSIFKADTDGTKSNSDMITFTMGLSKLYFIPLGNGQKIRGLRANIVITDEMNSLNTDIYEIVVNNFAAVAMNPIENMKRKAKIRSLEIDGLEVPGELLEEGFKNQSVIAGTMGFEFEPMYSYWKKYRDIIDTKGKAINEAFDGQDVDFSYKDFCIMRLPYELIPKGFMDDKTIARAKATIHAGAYASEYGCVPVKDTQGFFRRLIIEQCVSNDAAVASEGWPNWCQSSFDAKISGDKDSQYVMGVDPAADQDNFAIVIVEVLPEHQRIVYSWTTNRETVRKNNPETNYYSFCARHIRDLMRAFNIVSVGIDAQGGGAPLSEALHDSELLRHGEIPLWPEIVSGSKQDTDKMAGSHILNMIQFANYGWLSNANHSLRKDLEDRTILFPRYNSILLGLAGEQTDGKDINLEDCIINIEDLKTEMSTIVMTKTMSREKWDTPQIKTDSNKVGRMRKDRYSALLIANSIARSINRDMTPDMPVLDAGGAVGSINKVNKGNKRVEPYYYGNNPLSNKMGVASYRGVSR